MTQLTFRSDVRVELIDSMASDLAVTRSAQVSVKGENKPDTDTPRLINYLMSARHGSPFEHAVFTFFVEAPIFVFREWHRHRISSFNEMSGRYTKLLPHFYTPGWDRALVNEGTSARPEFSSTLTTEEQRDLVLISDRELAKRAWFWYETRLEAGVAPEVARTVLPVSIYSQMYWTVNARALMNFISLRTDARTHGIPDAEERGLPFSRPQREIELGAEKIEEHFKTLMPITHAAFVAAGRVAP